MTAWATGSWGSAWASSAWLAGIETEWAVYGATVEIATKSESADCGWETCAVGRVVIPDGNAIQMTVNWLDVDGDAATPDEVQYRVFDYETGDAVCDLTVVGSEASTMEIVIPGEHMPASTDPERRLAVQLQADFGDGQHTILRSVYVKRLYTF
jgi:hypothetical protein